jgi:hypothetical protein
MFLDNGPGDIRGVRPVDFLPAQNVTVAAGSQRASR